MDKKLKLKTELAKMLKKETSVTGTGASVTPGTGAGVATKYAFGKRDNKGTPSDWKSAPSIPNRPSKAMDYKELWESRIPIGTDTKTDSDVYFDNQTGTFWINVIDGAGNRWNKLQVNTIDDVLAKFPNWEWTGAGRDEFPEESGEVENPEVTTTKDYTASFAKDSRKQIKIPAGSKVKLLKARLFYDPNLAQIEYNGEKYNVASDSFLANHFRNLYENEGAYNSLAGILKQLGAEEDSIKVLIKAVEMGALKPSDAVTIVKKALGKKEIKEAKLDIDDRIKVTYGNEFYGETGTIVDIHRGFVTVEMDRDGKEYSMHSSDVQKIEDEDDEDMLQEGYAQFRNETKMRSKPDQFHQAVKQIKRKMNEINRIFEYVDRLKSELSEGEDLKYKKYTENAFQQIKESAKALFLKSTKLK